MKYQKALGDPATKSGGIVIAAGATAYTDFGKKNFLKFS